ncbi:MAG TPA: UDP-N-acetylmuramoyl-L-alanyl-D-glutamate--2,6-diaminopimelate ligase [Solirubrobacteraceae bacterium]|jgi:UDP-N-acetylmuramoyl-L-alanyl-D-glutamate--2,6-diaminopimelate ligase|nr:UDP-N-acetylmuramoyl-L-alanyl-D-glutamate--2,6-diaminopimelate ligase [Solirubrobacteraceae bacterium]
MRLDELTSGAALAGAGVTAGAGATEIAGLAYDSRRVSPGDLFFCVSGYRSDGHDFAAQAVDHGAAALVVERPLGLAVPELLVESARSAMAPIAARFYGDPTSELTVIGVTGTNGKTTTAYLVRSLLESAGVQCGLLGTVKSVIGGVERAVERTTPEAIDLQADFRAMLDAGDRACAMEVSSHALALGRAEAVRFAAAVFTNMSRDHLDFHDTMEDYFQAKRRLFVAPLGPPGVSVVNVGDDCGRRLAAEIEDVRTFAVGAPADYSASELRCDFDGCRFTLGSPDGEREVALPMPGHFNVANALGALATVHELNRVATGPAPLADDRADAVGVAGLDSLVAALERGVRVPGRFEPVDEGQDFAVLVDYAHTPDSLENVLRAARELIDSGVGPIEPARGRVIVVFGAGGDRDRGKRPLMGEISARLADAVVVTSDNPRSEDPDVIIAEILAGVEPPGPQRSQVDRRASVVRSVVDRAKAIAEAIAGAERGDVVVIAGKGHEQGQEFGDGRKVPFDDATVAREALRAREPAPVGDRPAGARA